MIPQTDRIVNEMVHNLKSELKEHFSFTPNSEKKLTEVALGTIGIFNGQQQLEGLRKKDAETDISLSNMLRQPEYSRDLELFLNHADPMVRKLAQQIKLMGTEQCDISWIIEDFDNDEPWCKALTRKEAIQALSALKSGHDATIGITWETLSYHAEQVIQERTFLIDDKEGGTLGTIKYYNYNEHPTSDKSYKFMDIIGNVYSLEWDSIAAEESEQHTVELAYFTLNCHESGIKSNNNPIVIQGKWDI